MVKPEVQNERTGGSGEGQPWIFVHIPKTGGIAMKRNLGRFDSFYKPPTAHLEARYIRMNVGAEAWDRCFTFSVIRNPWDRLVSAYAWYGMLGDPKRRRQSVEGFHAWVHNKRPMQSQWDMLRNEEGTEVLPKFLARFERYQEDFYEVCRRIGVVRPLERHNQSLRQRDYRIYYPDQATVDLVAEQYRKDVELGGYEF